MGSLPAAPLIAQGRAWKAYPRLPSPRRGGAGGWGLSIYSIYSVDIKNYCCAVNKHRRCDRTQTGVTPPAPERSEEPPVVVRNQKKPRRGDRVLNMLTINQLGVLSPLSGLSFVDAPVPGVNTPVCVLSHLRCFSPDTNIKNLRSLRSQRRPAFRRMRSSGAEAGFTLHGASVYTPWSIGSRSTEERLTLHGASAFAPRSVKPTPLCRR